jgi:hypothetical protein
MTEPWHRRKEIRVRVAGVTFRVTSSDPNGPELSVPAVSRKFEVPANGAVDLDLSACWGDLSQGTPGMPVFDSGGTWKLYRDGSAEVFRFWTAYQPSSPYLECRLDAGRSKGDVILHREFFESGEPVPVLQFPLDEILMVHLLGRGRGVELHACGVVTADGRGYLFAGQSGDGKTTTARLWEQLPGTLILSDDRIVIREEGGRFAMYGTPWHGEAELAANDSVPVDAVFILEHGSANRLIPLSVSEAAALLAARSFVPFHDVDALEWSLGFLGDFAGVVPCRRFAFVPDRSAREFILAGEAVDSRSFDSSRPRPIGEAPMTVVGGGS